MPTMPAPLSRYGTTSPARSPIRINPRPVVWYRSDQGLFQDAAGTIPATTGNPVGRWTDLSGNNHHATQATDPRRPTVSASTLAGAPLLTAAGNQALATAALAALQTRTQTWFAVLVPLASAPGLDRMAFATTYTGLDLAICLSIGSADNSTCALTSRTSAAGFLSTSLPTNGGAFPAAARALSDNSIILYKGLDSKSTLSGANYTFTTSTGLVLLNNGTAVRPMTGGCAEIIGFTATLSDSQTRSVLAYLKARYGL